MFRTYLLRGVAAGALSLPLIPPAAQAQQSLPTIDVGAPAPARTPRRAQGQAQGRAASPRQDRSQDQICRYPFSRAAA
jgi:hypothetical protein